MKTTTLLNVSFALLLLIVNSNGFSYTTVSKEICSNVIIEAPLEVEFTRTELEMLCDNKGPKEWQTISIPQKRFFITNFLQNRGLYDPQFSELNGILYVKLGAPAKVRRISLVNNTESIDPTRFWKVFGTNLMPETLDKIDSWIKEQYAERGYPCVTLETKAFPESGEIEIKLSNLQTQTMNSIEKDAIPNTLEHVDQRYYPFSNEDLYNSQKLQLASQRMKGDELLVNTRFIPDCNGTTFKIEQKTIAGEPRLISFGIGFDSEEYAISELRWKNTRFTDTASSLDAYIRASYRTINAELGFDWYYAPVVPRHSIRSSISFTRNNEDNYDSRTVEVSLGPTWSHDFSQMRFYLWPSIASSHTELVRGEGLDNSKLLSLRLLTELESHDHELFVLDPRSGYKLSYANSFSNKDIASDLTVSTHDLRVNYLVNAFDFDPAIWIFGVRAHVATTIIGRDTLDSNVPGNLKQRLGGTSNLRGFGRNLIAEEGALVSGYLGAETRIANILPYGLQPLFFIDFGKVGRQQNNFDKELFWNPGLGMHWQSPIGAIRGTIAHGFVESPSFSANTKERWQGYLSLGEQF